MPEAAVDSGAPAPASESVAESTVESIQSTLDSVFENDVVDDGDTETAEPADKTPAEPSTETETPAAESATEEPKTPTAEAAAPKAPTLPAAYRRSLKAMEWTDAEIDDAASDPRFLATAAKIHQTRNKEVAAWADLGRKTKEAAAAPPPAKEAPKPATFQGYTPEEIKALKDTYGEDAGGLIDSMAGKVNLLVDSIKTMMPVIEQTQARSQQAQADMLNRQITGFFSSKELAPYKDTYGTDLSKLTETQLGQRNKVLEYADALIGGAAQQGRNLSFEEAMNLAHDAMSGGIKTQAARTEVRSQLQARAYGITLRPGARAAAPASSKAQLEQNVKKGLGKLFI